MKQAFPAVVGNQKLREHLSREIVGGSLSHAYIIEGAQGSGRHTLSLQLAAALSCEQLHEDGIPLPCGRCLACRNILGGFSTDVIYVNREDRATLGVGTIRRLREDVLFPPNDMPRKLYLIEEAHLLTEEAQNAFLLTLEEPPPYAMFLLLCDTSAPLLETIKSRAPILRMESLERELIDGEVCRKSIHAAEMKRREPEKYRELLSAANGSIGRMLTLLDPEGSSAILGRRELVREFVSAFLQQKSAAAAVRLFRRLPQKRDALTEHLELALLCLRDLLLCKQSDRVPLCFFTSQEEASDMAYRFTIPELLRMSDSVRDAISRLQANSNVHLTLHALAADVGIM